MSSEPVTIFGLPIEMLSLGFSVVTTFSALLLAVIALSHTARPRIKIDRITKGKYYCGEAIRLRFKVSNKGYWFARPMVVRLAIYCNFHEDFLLKKLSYGSRQENTDDIVKLGKGGFQYFKVENVMLSSSKLGEEFYFDLQMPEISGKYPVNFSAYSENGVSYRKSFTLRCVDGNRPLDEYAVEETDDHAAVRLFYDTVSYGGGTHPGDRLLVARGGDEVVAAARLCKEEESLVLRGMYVAQECRRQGLGSKLLEVASATIGSSECWCLPHTHLMGFYSQIGFKESEAIPEFLAKRHSRYTKSGRVVTAMRRPSFRD